LCDVFTDRPLAGNALAVFTDANGLDDATMLSGPEALPVEP
jgi:predicted PhzF superfamily epimerase YddE/YHI9